MRNHAATAPITAVTPIAVLLTAVAASVLHAQAPATHRLEASPSTVAYGYYWSAAKPVLRIASGDILDVDTLFEIGDGHAAQGDGEVDQTAIETSLRARIQLTVRKGMSLAWPRAETATDYISMATDPDLTAATRVAIQQMIDFVASTMKMTRHQAYQLVSIAGNVAVTQLVDQPNVGVHVRLPKSIFAAARQSERPSPP